MEEDIISEQNEEQEDTKKNKSKDQSESKKAMNGLQGGIICGLLLGIGAWGVYHYYQYAICKILFWTIIVLMVICFAAAVSCFVDWKSAKKREKLEEEAKKEEEEFSEIDPSKRALRAEKMFKLNQKDLMRYYDMNLSQTRFLSGLGIVMIILGILIVVASLVLYVYLNTDRILLFVGNISGIIVDFVGAIFIKMYTQNVDAAVRFHAKFAESNNLLLANSIANKIENEELREATLSEISKQIVALKQNSNT